jgi:chromosome partitioning protein
MTAGKMTACGILPMARCLYCLGAELLLRKAIRKLPGDRWDFLFIDCPPSLGLLTVSALAAVKEILIPVEAHVMALAGLVALLQTVEVVKDRLNPDLSVSAVLACRVDSRTNLSRDVVETLRERFGRLVLRTAVRENVKLAEAPSFAKPITLYDPRSAGAEDYRAVATELLKKWKD